MGSFGLSFGSPQHLQTGLSLHKASQHLPWGWESSHGCARDPRYWTFRFNIWCLTCECGQFLHTEGFVCLGLAQCTAGAPWGMELGLLHGRSGSGQLLREGASLPPAWILLLDPSSYALGCRLFSRRRSDVYTTRRPSKSHLLSQSPSRMALCCWLSIPCTHQAGRICPLSNLQGTLQSC